MRLRLFTSFAWAVSTSIVAGCGQQVVPASTKPTVLPVTAVAVHHQDSFSYPITYYGRVEPARRAALSFERPGRLEQVLVDEGEFIASGTVVARLDTSLLEAEKNVLLSQRKTETAILNRLRKGERAEVIAAVRADAMRLEVEVSRALADYNRNQQAYVNNTISRADFDQARYTHEAAVYSLKQATLRLEELESGSRAEDVEAQASRVDVIDSQLKLNAVQFEKSALEAPFACVTIQRFQDEGVTLSPGQVVLEINEANRLKARFSIPYANLDLLAEAKSLQINGHPYVISDARAISKIDNMMRTVDVLIPLKVDAKDHVLPGQTCTLVLTKLVEADCMVVPISALVASVRGLWSCYRLQPDPAEKSVYTVEKVDLTIIHTDGAWVIAPATLSEGSLIVTQGAHKVVQGMKVRLAEGAG